MIGVELQHVLNMHYCRTIATRVRTGSHIQIAEWQQYYAVPKATLHPFLFDGPTRIDCSIRVTVSCLNPAECLEQFEDVIAALRVHHSLSGGPPPNGAKFHIGLAVFHISGQNSSASLPHTSGLRCIT
jgi:hypothetical protein